MGLGVKCPFIHSLGAGRNLEVPGQSVKGTERKQRPRMRKLAAQVISKSRLECRPPDTCSVPYPLQHAPVGTSLWNRNSSTRL